MNNYKLKMDANGNQIVTVKPANGRGFSIQTNGNMPTTHRDGVGAWTEGEVREYVRKFGTAGQRAALGILQTVYLNWRGPCGVETVDEFTAGDNAPVGRKEFRAYVRKMAEEYGIAGMAVYQSSRACKAWKERA